MNWISNPLNRAARDSTSKYLAPFIFVTAGLVFSFLWRPLIDHETGWIQPGDIWGTLKAAHMVAWGDIGDIYKSGSGLVTFPAIAIVLAPVALISSAMHLSESFPWSIAHASAWPILAPVEMCLGAFPLIPLDKLARRLGIEGSRRLVLMVAEMIALWPTVVLWGHPEDAVAVGLLLVSLDFLAQDRVAHAGWVAGLAIAFQPLVVPTLPLVLMATPWGRRRMFLLRCALPSAVLLVIPLVQAWSATIHSILKAPNFPGVDHPTPWIAFAPVISKQGKSNGAIPYFSHGELLFIHLSHQGNEIVAAGPGRLLALVAAGIAALIYWRRRDPRMLFWFVGVSLALRCLFESVMDPFYLWPAVALFLVAAASASPAKWCGALACSATLLVYAQQFHTPWVWWLPIVAMLALLAYFALPDLKTEGSASCENVEALPRGACTSNESLASGLVETF